MENKLAIRRILVIAVFVIGLMLFPSIQSQATRSSYSDTDQRSLEIDSHTRSSSSEPHLEVRYVKVGELRVESVSQIYSDQWYYIQAYVSVKQSYNNPAKNVKACLEGFNDYSPWWKGSCQSVNLGDSSGTKGTWLNWKAKVDDPSSKKRFGVTAYASNAKSFSYVWFWKVQ